MSKFMLSALVVCASTAAFAAPKLPNLELVKKYLQSSATYDAKIATCKGTPLVPEDDLECWAAHTAKDLSRNPKDTQELILDAQKLEVAMSKCAAMSGKERFESRMCTAANQAEVFISLRLPRTASKLKPLQFK